MNKVLDQYCLSKLTHEETDKLNTEITSVEIKTAVTNLVFNKAQDQEALQMLFIKSLKIELMLILMLLSKIEAGTLFNIFYHANIFLILKSHKLFLE